MRIATGCQDGLLRIYNTSNPSSEPEKRQMCEKGSSGYATKVVWVDASVLMVGTKDGDMQLWDMRQNASNSGPCLARKISEDISKAYSIMDIEYNVGSGNALVTCGRKV
jgi:hypothetical protein